MITSSAYAMVKANVCVGCLLSIIIATKLGGKFWRDIERLLMRNSIRTCESSVLATCMHTYLLHCGTTAHAHLHIQ